VEKLLPQHIDAEMGVLGSIVIDPDALLLVADFLKPEHFYRDAHATIYRAMLAIAEKNQPADFLMICDYLEQRNEIEQVGGGSYITSLLNNVPTSAYAEHYGRIVAKAGLHRELVKAAGKIAAYGYEEADNALEQAENLIFGLSRQHESTGFVSAMSIMRNCSERYETLQAKRGGITGIPTGFTELDGMLGGLRRSKLYLLAGRPGSGKSSLALCIALHAAIEHKYRVGILSIEMPTEELGDKMVAIHARVDTQDLSKGWLNAAEWDRVYTSTGFLSEQSIEIDDTAVLSLSSLKSKAKRLQVEKGVDLLIVDYLQLMEATKDGKPIDNEVQELSMISRGLKQLAREMDIPVLALAQLSRKVEERQNKRPMLSDLRGSGTLEQDADVVAFIYRDEMYNPESEMRGKAEIIMEKHRGGPRGTRTVGFEDYCTAFYDLTPGGAGWT
jgi:replicative DNA helicase